MQYPVGEHEKERISSKTCLLYTSLYINTIYKQHKNILFEQFL